MLQPAAALYVCDKEQSFWLKSLTLSEKHSQCSYSHREHFMLLNTDAPHSCHVKVGLCSCSCDPVYGLDLILEHFIFLSLQCGCLLRCPICSNKSCYHQRRWITNFSVCLISSAMNHTFHGVSWFWLNEFFISSVSYWEKPESFPLHSMTCLFVDQTSGK